MPDIDEYTRGSEWRKWDLQVHTPYSALNNQFGDNFDEYVKQLFKSAIANNICAIGITDYFLVDGYRKLNEEYLSSDTKLAELFTDEEVESVRRILVLPNIEFRLNKLVEGNRINFHVVFSNDVSLSDITENFLQEIKFVYQGGPQSEDEERALTRSNLEALGAKLIEEHAGFAGKPPLYVGMMNAVVDDTGIMKLLVNKKSIFRQKYITLVPSDEDLSSISWDGQDHNVRKVIIQKADALFASNDKTVNWSLGLTYESPDQYITEFKSLKPCLRGSDAHSFDELFRPAENKHCWIKADATFDGLRQVLYEPYDRVRLQEVKPTSPVRKIASVKLSFPADTTISLGGGSEDTFCLAGINTCVPLSDYFNCFIGGRGTGKSTLLNLLCKAADDSIESDFFDNNRIRSNGDEINLTACIEIDSSAEAIEFLEQNQIETFATNSSEFTKAIYSRLKNKDRSIAALEEALVSSLAGIDDQISRVEVKHTQERELEELRRQHASLKKIADTVATDDYRELVADIQDFNAQYLTLKNDREAVDAMRTAVIDFVSQYEVYELDNDSSEYRKQFNAFLKTLTALEAKVLDPSQFTASEQREKALLENVNKKQEELEAYLKKQGLEEENLQEVKTASTKADEYERLIDSSKAKLDKLHQQIAAYDLPSIQKTVEDYNAQVSATVAELTEVLELVNKENPEDVDKINMRVSFDEPAARQRLFEDLLKRFDHVREDLNFKQPDVYSCLFSTPPEDLLSGKATYKDLVQSISGPKQYNMFLERVLKEQHHFEIYRLLIQKHFLNAVKHLKIDVSYKNKPMQHASFGQKCTAVIVIMLLFGHNPIIIDEPEAHLDSSLIANYLVALIKQQKMKRQIIFATHNANFVINADAEQIYILEMPDKQTQISQTTIENMQHRDKLLKLEGGEKAFLKRESKYGCERTH